MKRYSAEEQRLWLASRSKKIVDVKIILESDKGNVLLVKPDYKETWQLPGGGIDADESPEEAAVREIHEETSLTVSPKDLKIVATVFKRDEELLFLIFEYVKRLNEQDDFKSQDVEITGYEFVHPSVVADRVPAYYSKFWNSYLSVHRT